MIFRRVEASAKFSTIDATESPVVAELAKSAVDTSVNVTPCDACVRDIVANMKSPPNRIVCLPLTTLMSPLIW